MKQVFDGKEIGSLGKAVNAVKRNKGKFAFLFIASALVIIFLA